MLPRTIVLDTVNKIGQEVRLCGWVNTRRNMGKIIFIDFRDRSGLVQVILGPKELDEASKEIIKTIRPEFVLEIIGTVNARPVGQIKKEQPTGAVEIMAKSVTILSESETPPFEIDNEILQANEELRLKYRYLDLRHERMKKNIIIRDKVFKYFRDYLSQNGFLEIETPILCKGTPEGAREYLVPSRVYPGQFYVLPQSPQQFKQLLMVAGIEKYFQVAKCFRDEDSRGDRQPEFTQLDLEMSFVEREDVMNLIEDMQIKTIKDLFPQKHITQTPFPRFNWKEAMEKYGTAKPDIRKDKNDKDELGFCWIIDFPFFEKTDEGKWTFTHNPFSAPKPEFMENLMKKENIEEIITTQYDLALNGVEAGGGSIRNHRPEALRKVFEIMDLTREQIENNFGHIFEAFKYGAPPHGGIALGLDRLIMILQNEPSIREVMAFPKTSDGRDPMMGAPSEIPTEKIKEANIKIL